MDSNTFKDKIKYRIWDYFKEFFYYQRVEDSPVVLNLNNNCNPDQKRALLCYLPYGYFRNPTDFEKIGRTIAFEIYKMVKVLSESGYRINIISANDIKSLNLIRSDVYDLIFGFGDTFYEMVRLQPNALSILYMTENHPDISIQAEMERINYYFKRHRRSAPIERSGRFYKKEHLLRKYDQVIALGEVQPFKPQYANPYNIYPTGVINPDYVYEDRNHLETRKHFLWLGSSAVIHKGLDILTDVFGQRDDIYLHICGLNDNARKFLKIPERANIFDYGFVQIKSESFLNIAKRCSYSILPSCSEGCATSITTSMLHGLIPVVIKDTGFNRLGEAAIFLDDYRIEYVSSKLTELATCEPKELRSFSNRVFKFAHMNFTISVFEENFRAIIQDILKRKEKE